MGNYYLSPEFLLWPLNQCPCRHMCPPFSPFCIQQPERSCYYTSCFIYFAQKPPRSPISPEGKAQEELPLPAALFSHLPGLLSLLPLAHSIPAKGNGFFPSTHLRAFALAVPPARALSPSDIYMAGFFTFFQVFTQTSPAL